LILPFLIFLLQNQVPGLFVESSSSHSFSFDLSNFTNREPFTSKLFCDLYDHTINQTTPDWRFVLGNEELEIPDDRPPSMIVNYGVDFSSIGVSVNVDEDSLVQCNLATVCSSIESQSNLTKNGSTSHFV